MEKGANVLAGNKVRRPARSCKSMTQFSNHVPNTDAAKRTRWGPVLLVIGALVLYVLLTRPAPPLEGWGTNFNAALQQAGVSDRRVLVAFSMPGCAPCAVMNRNVLPASKVKKALVDFELVHLDATVHTELAVQYEVYGTPTYAVIDANGQLLSKREGTLTVDEFVAFLSRAARLPADPQPPLRTIPVSGAGG